MAQTFDIRFARSAGFAAMLAAPTNSFRWTGNGHLSIDAQGISVALKRGLSSLLTRNRTRRIAAADLKEVFREGEALRVEFATGKSARDSLQFWANDRDTAAQIVSLLPTTRTVELEESAQGGKFRVNRRATVLLVAVLAATGAAVFVLRHDEAGVASVGGATAQSTSTGTPAARVVEARAAVSPSTGNALPAKLPAADARYPARPREIVIPVYPNRPTPLSAKTPVDGPAAADAPDAYALAAEGDTAASSMRQQLGEPQPVVFTVRVSSDGIVPIVPGMASYEAARKELVIFLNAGEKGLWWELTMHVHNDWAFDDPALWPLRDAELAASRAWRSYSDAIGHVSSQDAAAEREFAQLLTNRVYQYVSTTTN